MTTMKNSMKRKLTVERSTTAAQPLKLIEVIYAPTHHVKSITALRAPLICTLKSSMEEETKQIEKK